MSKVVGIQSNVSFKYDGVDYSGIRLFCTDQDSERKDLVGVSTSADFIGQHKPELFEVAKTLKVGDEVKILRNRWNKVEDIILK